MSSIEKAMRKQAEADKNKQNKQNEPANEVRVSVTQDTQIDLKPEGQQVLAEKAPTNEQETLTTEPLINETTQANLDKDPLTLGQHLEIDLERLEQKGFVALSKKRTLINEEFRSIKRKLLNNAFGGLAKTLNHSNLILVSSSRPNEGKTFCAVNLALSIALEKDKTVLLVDADVLKPSVSKTLELGANAGLIEYLSGEVEDVSSVIYQTNVENLRVIPAGLPHYLSNELLSSDKMQQLFDEFASRYPDRIVIFDCPPLLGVNETTVMAEQCGQGVIVVEEFKSKLTEVKKAVDLLPEEMAVGLVMNKVIDPSDTQGYGYYYGSGA
ncbi:polysaccharide biosynthesis tyrosine autokinase [Psychrosphaera ytuae]|uniref:non-specific protein-tyrosine kinase n=1 Tax=Psychrosphaera ytuae TaxID=2820710 RepID=A0A975HJE7_9GAMM|nr:XrtA-associated tyrosine autokinase [Psychrosphaera ytuae]QTH63134.1 polysaccharide biosynthesis tyrosine autokinase [Psychrosphaera ytuae]